MKPPTRSTRLSTTRLRELVSKRTSHTSLQEENESDDDYYNSSSNYDSSSSEILSLGDDSDIEANHEEFLGSCLEDCIDEVFSFEKGDFELDNSKIQPIIVKKLRRELKKHDLILPKKTLNGIVKQFLDSGTSDILREYCGTKPADKRWKVGLKRTRVEELEPILKRCRIDIEKNKPTMEKILSANISESNRREAIRLFDVLENCEPYTNYYYDIEKRINDLIVCNVDSLNIADLELYDKKLRKEFSDSTNDMRVRIFNLDTTEEIKSIIYKRHLRLESIDASTANYSTEREWLRWAVSLPYRKRTEEEKDMAVIRQRLDDELYGMNDVKERLMEIINDRKTNPLNRGAQIGLCGKPGCGKTSIAEATANALNIPFFKISLAGMEDASTLKGTDNVWVGASPSVLLKSMSRTGSCRGIVLFDEIDKLRGSRCEAVQDALLHITDYSHNHSFQDVFISEFNHDLSGLWFFYAMNDTNGINSILLDRMSIMTVRSYTYSEIDRIVTGYVLPKALKNVGMSIDDVKLDGGALKEIRNLLSGRESCDSIRSYEKMISELVSKINMLKTNRELVKSSRTPLRVSYDIEGFDVPIVLSREHVKKLLKRDDSSELIMSMYI